MKKAYLSIGYQSRKDREPEIETMRQVLHDLEISLYVFVDTYHFSPKEEKQMMQQAFTDISTSVLLLAETSEKAIGVGIEIGYAAALNIPVICLRNILSEHSTTAAGTADYAIIYENNADLAQKLRAIVTSLEI